MSTTFHFISGLPRSGSTLLAAILRQNPRFHASMTSGLGALVSGAMQIMSPGAEVALTLVDGQREDILRSLFRFFDAQRGIDRGLCEAVAPSLRGTACAQRTSSPLAWA